MARISEGGSADGSDDSDGDGGGGSSGQQDRQAVERFKQAVKETDSGSQSTPNGGESSSEPMSNREAAREFKESVNGRQASQSGGMDTSGQASASAADEAPRAAQRAVRQDQQRGMNPQRQAQQAMTQRGRQQGVEASVQRAPQGAQRAVRQDRMRGPSARRHARPNVQRAVEQTPEGAKRKTRSRQTPTGMVDRALSGLGPGGGGQSQRVTPGEVGAGVAASTVGGGDGDSALDAYGRDLKRRAREEISPIAAIGLERDQFETAAKGERELFERGERGELSGELYTGGEVIQHVGTDIGGDVESFIKSGQGDPEFIDTSSRRPGDGFVTYRPETTDRKSVDLSSTAAADLKRTERQVRGRGAEFTRGVVQTQFYIAGGIPQAGVVASEGVKAVRSGSAGPEDISKAEDRVVGTAKTGAKRNIEYAKEHPVEAAIILGTPAVVGRGGGSGRGVSRAKSAVKSAKSRASSSPRAQEFVADTRAQGKLTGKTRGGSRQGETVENVGQIDPRKLGKGKREGRAAEMELQTGTRPGRRGSGEQRAFAEKLRGFKEIESQTPSVDLRTVAEFPSASRGVSKGAVAGAASGGAASTQAADDLRQRIRQAQRPAVEETPQKPSGGEEDLSFARPRGDAIQRLKSMQRQAEKTAVDSNEVSDPGAGADITFEPPGTRFDTRPDDRGDTRTRDVQTPGDVQAPGTTQKQTPDVPPEHPPITRTTQTSDSIPATPTRNPPPSNPPSRGTRRPPVPPAVPPFPLGGDTSRPRDQGFLRQTKVVRNPVAAPSEFDEAAELAGLDNAPNLDAVGEGKKKKKRKKSGKDSLYDFFS